MQLNSKDNYKKQQNSNDVPLAGDLGLCPRGLS